MKLPSETILGTTSETILTVLLVLNTLVQVLYSICQGALGQEWIDPQLLSMYKCS